MWSGDPCLDLRRSLSHGPHKIVKIKKVLSTKMANISVERSAEEAHIVVTGKSFQENSYISIVDETVCGIVVNDEIFEVKSRKLPHTKMYS